MKILLLQCIYNEINMLPWKYAWAKRNGLDIFTFDNFSTDGSTEWLKKNSPGKFEMLDTDGKFSLRLNNEACLRKFHEVKPDWCIIAGCDMFYQAIGFRTIAHFISYLSKMSFNIVECNRLYNYYFTGEENDQNCPQVEYRYYREENQWPIRLIARYHPSLKIDGDVFHQENEKILKYPNLICHHYWFRSDAESRFKEKLKRRAQSWHDGTDILCHGKHYNEIVKKNIWVFPKENLKKRDDL
ncbi:MAG: glycosyltransferase family 2 protein [candidate division KSB1 bacterium]|nr:glycosyltransferase family 2 protein [candidate division KSB1 bacterium]